MAIVPAPPGMQPWIRTIEQRLAAAERGVKAAGQVINSGGRVSGYAESRDAVITAQGVVTDWSLLTSAEGPSLSGQGVGQRVKVTVSAVCEGWRPGTAGGAASGLMRATLQPVDEYRKSPRADVAGGIGFGCSFDYPAGSAATQQFCGSFSQVMTLPIGPYTIRSEYLYTQSVSGIAVRWSSRTLMIESF